MNDNLSSAQFAYHAAPKSARDSIAQHGLDASHSPVASQPRDPRNLAPVATYLFRDRRESEDMMSEGMHETHDLYEVNLGKAKTHPDPYQPESAIYTTDVIPPTNLRRL